jgi:hypothetical protein
MHDQHPMNNEFCAAEGGCIKYNVTCIEDELLVDNCDYTAGCSIGRTDRMLCNKCKFGFFHSPNGESCIDKCTLLAAEKDGETCKCKDDKFYYKNLQGKWMCINDRSKAHAIEG